MTDKAQSYRHTALIALGSLGNIILSVIRNKFFSVFLGPVGIGQFGMLSDFINTTYSLGSLGVANSGVQAISKASINNRTEVRQVFNTLVDVFTMVSLVLFALIMIFAGPLSVILTGDAGLTWVLRVSAVALLFKFRSSLQSVLITGLQKVSLLAKGLVFQGLAATLLGIALVYVLKTEAVPFLVIAVAFSSWIVTHIQSRSVVRELPDTSRRQELKAMLPVLALGISTIWASFLESMVNLINKSWITRGFGDVYLGYYQVAVGFTGTYIRFITSSIITNYYPKLVVKAGESREAFNQFVNEQISMSMNLIMPLLMIMLTFSKPFLLLMFSEKFLAADALLIYTVAGTFLLVVAWPIAYVFLARRATVTYILTESVGNLSMLLLSYLALRSGQFSNMGLAYLLHYVVYLVLITWMYCRKFDGYISRGNVRLFLINAVMIALMMLAKKFLPDHLAYIIGSLMVALYFFLSRREYAFMFRSVFKSR